MTDFTLGPGPLIPEFEQIKSDIGIVENGDVATHAIPAGYYVIWKGDLYVARTDISSGTALSAESNGNLTAKTQGIGAEVSELNSKLDSLTIYTDITSLNLQTGASLASIYSAMVYPSVAYILASDVAEQDRVGTANTYSSGYIKIEKRTNARSRIYYIHKTNTDNDYEMAIDSNNVPTGTWIHNSVSALNSNIAQFQGIEISENTDLNNITTPGNYYSPNGARSATLVHAPIANGGFALVVMKKGNYVEQQAQTGGIIFTRGLSSSGFNEWEQLALNSKLNFNQISASSLSDFTNKIDAIMTDRGFYTAYVSNTDASLIGLNGAVHLLQIMAFGASNILVIAYRLNGQEIRIIAKGTGTWKTSWTTYNSAS